MQLGTPLMKDAAPSPSDCGTNQPQDRTDQAYVTVLTNAKGRLGKEFSWVKGKVQKLSNASLYKGHAKTAIADTAEQLASIFESLQQNQAIALGVINQNGRVPLASDALAGPNDITRSKEYFKYQHGPGWLLFDVDDLPDHIKDRVDNLGGTLAAIMQILPELRTGEYVVRPSSSGGIISPDGKCTTSGKLHIYVRVSDVSQSKAILTALHQRAWVMGFGFIKLSESGSVLERSLFDTAVASPERIVYEAPPTVHSPLKREVAPTKWVAGDTLEPPEAPDQDVFDALVKEAKEKAVPESRKAKKRYIDKHVRRITKESGVSNREARRIVKKRSDGGILEDNDFIDGPDGAPLRVGDLLDRNQKQIALRRLEVHERYRRVPTLLLDATANIELLKLRLVFARDDMCCQV